MIESAPQPDDLGVKDAQDFLKPDTVREPPPMSLPWKVVNWTLLILSEVGMTASFVLFLLGVPLILAEGGYVASGGPYEIAHPITQPMWVFFIGYPGLVFAIWGQKLFAALLDAPRLLYVSLLTCAVGMSAVTFSFAAGYPSSDGRHTLGLIWGVVMAVIAVGLLLLRVLTAKTLNWQRSKMTGRPLVVFWIVTAIALSVGAYLGLRLGAGGI